jgi:hypothetical protein
MDLTNTYSKISDLNLWFKARSGDQLTLADISALIPLRWTYIRDNWETRLLPSIIRKLSTYANPSILKTQLDSFTKFVKIQRTSTSGVNPLSSSDIFYRNYLVFDAITLDTAPVTKQEQAVIDNAVNRVSGFTKTDFVAIHDAVMQARDILADSVGGTDVNYNATYHRSPSMASLDITIENVSQMQLYNNIIQTTDFILANIFSLDTVTVDPFALAKANANNSDFDMAAYTSGKLVRMNYGEDLRDLANRYLGDSDKFIDIAIANGLKPPYIDESGQALPLIANGSQNQINIAKTDVNGNLNIDKFFINQIVILQSDTQRFSDQRIVVNIREVPVSGELIIELNGDNNLNIYQINDNANIRVFKPNTINSSFLILIPSTSGIPTPQEEVPFFLKSAGEDEKKAKIDFLLDDRSGDLIFNSTSDFALSFGLVNAIQAIKLKLLIEQGSLRKHPEYGFVVSQGQKNNNLSAGKAAIVESINSQIEMDSRFERVESLDINYFGSGSTASGFTVDIVVRLAGSNATIPISFSVNVS